MTIHQGDAAEVLRGLEPGGIQCCVTSPPYWQLRDYGVAGQIGREVTPQEYVARLVAVFAEVRRCLRPDGTLWVNIDDTYNNYLGGARDSEAKSGYADDQRPRFAKGYGLLDPTLPRKSLVGIPERFAIAMLDAGWLMRSRVTWKKEVNLSDRATDRPAHKSEALFLFTARPDYRFHRDRLPVEHRDDVWSLPHGQSTGGHRATFPEKLVARCVLAGTDPGDVVLDPFAGTGTTARVALGLGRRSVAVELNPRYCDIIRRRCGTTIGLPLSG